MRITFLIIPLMILFSCNKGDDPQTPVVINKCSNCESENKKPSAPSVNAVIAATPVESVAPESPIDEAPIENVVLEEIRNELPVIPVDSDDGESEPQFIEVENVTVIPTKPEAQLSSDIDILPGDEITEDQIQEDEGSVENEPSDQVCVITKTANKEKGSMACRPSNSPKDEDRQEKIDRIKEKVKEILEHLHGSKK